MFKIKCFCGKSEKTFFKNIGPNYHAECCEEAGFDHLGKQKVISVKEIKEISNKITKNVDALKDDLDKVLSGEAKISKEVFNEVGDFIKENRTKEKVDKEIDKAVQEMGNNLIQHVKEVEEAGFDHLGKQKVFERPAILSDKVLTKEEINKADDMGYGWKEVSIENTNKEIDKAVQEMGNNLTQHVKEVEEAEAKHDLAKLEGLETQIKKAEVPKKKRKTRKKKAK